jgi:homeobox protein cut-like
MSEKMSQQLHELNPCHSFTHSFSLYRFVSEEIDNLTRRSKQTETAFTSLTSALASVPDPASLLDASTEQMTMQQQQLQEMAQRMEDLARENDKLQKQIRQQQSQTSSGSSGFSSAKEEELIQLRREVAEYEVEFRSLKNQDITIRKLEARIAELQAGSETELQERLEAAKQELVETEGRRTAEALEREAMMERQVASLTLQLKAERAGRAATQAHLLEESEGAGEREAAWEAQRQILVDDSERVRLSLHEATRERDELRLKVAALEGGSGSMGPAPASGGIPMADLLSERKAYEAEVAELSSTISALREEMAVKDSGIDNERRTNKLRVDTLEREIRKLNTDLSEMAMQLEAAPSQSLVDSMKRELRILKRLEYNADDADLPERDPEIAGGNEDHEKDLESVLVAKLRRVESELVRERNNVSQIKADNEALESAMKEMQKSKAEAEETIATLEKDLDRAISSSTASTTPKSGQRKSASNIPPLAPSDPATLQSVLDPDSASTPQTSPPSSNAETMNNTSAAEKAADDHSVATIIMAQRDRLRARCDALEAERDSFKRELQAQVDAAESLKADNTKLFEKMRYLQSYNSNSSGRAGTYSRSASIGSNRDLDLEALEERYVHFDGCLQPS